MPGGAPTSRTISVVDGRESTCRQSFRSIAVPWKADEDLVGGLKREADLKQFWRSPVVTNPRRLKAVAPKVRPIDLTEN